MNMDQLNVADNNAKIAAGQAAVAAIERGESTEFANEVFNETWLRKMRAQGVGAGAQPPVQTDRERLHQQGEDLHAGRVTWDELKRRATAHAQTSWDNETPNVRRAWDEG